MVQTIKEMIMEIGPLSGSSLKPKRLNKMLRVYKIATPTTAPVITARKRAVGTITLNFQRANMLNTTTKVDITAVDTMPGYLSSKVALMQPKATPSATAVSYTHLTLPTNSRV